MADSKQNEADREDVQAFVKGFDDLPPTFEQRMMALPPGAGAKRPPPGGFVFRYNALGCAGRARGV
jgi:hypothetical protein